MVREGRERERSMALQRGRRVLTKWFEGALGAAVQPPIGCSDRANFEEAENAEVVKRYQIRQVPGNCLVSRRVVQLASSSHLLRRGNRMSYSQSRFDPGFLPPAFPSHAVKKSSQRHRGATCRCGEGTCMHATSTIWKVETLFLHHNAGV